jgi:hypothetical protein
MRRRVTGIASAIFPFSLVPSVRSVSVCSQLHNRGVFIVPTLVDDIVNQRFAI